jgi:hypothetical protein
MGQSSSSLLDGRQSVPLLERWVKLLVLRALGLRKSSIITARFSNPYDFLLHLFQTSLKVSGIMSICLPPCTSTAFELTLIDTQLIHLFCQQHMRLLTHPLYISS